MGFLKKVLGTEPDSTNSDAPSVSAPSEKDHRLLAAAAVTLESAGFVPRQEPSLAHVLRRDEFLQLERLRARPLTTLLALRDLDDEPIYEGIWVDPRENTRTQATDLVDLVRDIAIATGQEEELGEITLMYDPGSQTSGSLRFRVGEYDVHDVSFDLDPDFGDESAETQIMHDLAPGGTVAHLLFEQPTARCTAVWAASSQEGFFAALDAENA